MCVALLRSEIVALLKSTKRTVTHCVAHFGWYISIILQFTKHFHIFNILSEMIYLLDAIREASLQAC